MKKIKLTLLSFLILNSIVLINSCSSSKKMQTGGKDDVLVPLRLANNYFMQKWPDAGKPIVTNRERPSNIWTRAVYYEGLMALYSIDKKKQDRKSVV